MDRAGLRVCSLRNRLTFEKALGPYVTAKIEQTLGRGEGWLDASGCVWCLFDNGAFERSGSLARELRDDPTSGFDLQVFWSMEDVVMPRECDERWVARRIADEAQRQLGERGYRAELEERMAEGGRHLGVRIARCGKGGKKK